MKLSSKQKKLLYRIIASVILIGASAFFEERNRILSIAFFVLAYFTIGYDILLRAWKGIKRGRPFDENFLMAVATLGAIGLGDLTEGCAVMIFYQIGELFESIAVGKSRRNIAELIDIRPDYANIEHEDGVIERVSPDSVSVGEIIIVNPGEKVPLDGVVTEGSSAIDTSALTGESALRDVSAGNEILSGTINMTGVLRIRTTREFGESTASKILDLVENASSKKSRSEDFISKFARIYTPAVCLSAVALALLPPLVILAAGKSPDWGDWLYRALTFLVISCPCALVISIPMTFFGGIGGASRAGILIKGSNYMEPLSRARYLVFDKTGTMTKGVFEVSGVHRCPIEDEKLIELAALAESFSSHPISLSLQRAYGKEIDRTRVSDVHEYSGEGVTAVVDGYRIAAGNEKLMKREKLVYPVCGCSGTLVHVAINGIYSGHIVIEDQIKPSAAESIADMKRNGVKKTVMLTGDNASTAEKVAELLGIDEVHAGLMPADKVSIVEQILKLKGRKENLAFVGDGINDAPVLSRADVGIAMGGIGSDAAIEAADVVLMDDDPMKISKAIRIARKCMRIAYENIWAAIGIKVICLVLSAIGFASIWLAIFADTGVLILAVLNAMRALNTKRI